MTKFTVNDRPVEYKMDPETPLLWALRDASNLTGTKFGCGAGDCGACMVEIDGEAIRSCLVTISEAEGRFVTTIEGLSRTRAHPVQQAMVAEGAVQCGFCTPGIVMNAAALLRKSSNPSDEEIDVAITNLCRCGIYPRLREAIKRAGRVMRGEEKIAAVPPPGITPGDAAKAVPALKGPAKEAPSKAVPAEKNSPKAAPVEEAAGKDAAAQQAAPEKSAAEKEARLERPVNIEKAPQ